MSVGAVTRNDTRARRSGKASAHEDLDEEKASDSQRPGLTVRAVNTLGGKVGQLFKVGVPVHPPSSPPGISSEDGEEPVGLEKATYMTISFS